MNLAVDLASGVPPFEQVREGIRARVDSVVADPATVDPRFLLDETKADMIADVVERHWPEQIDPADLGDAALAATVAEARGRLLEALDLSELA